MHEHQQQEFVDTVVVGQWAVRTHTRDPLTLPGTKQFSAQALQTTRRASGPAFFF